jgi:hypothetical protein
MSESTVATSRHATAADTARLKAMLVERGIWNLVPACESSDVVNAAGEKPVRIVGMVFFVESDERGVNGPSVIWVDLALVLTKGGARYQSKQVVVDVNDLDARDWSVEVADVIMHRLCSMPWTERWLEAADEKMEPLELF